MFFFNKLIQNNYLQIILLVIIGIAALNNLSDTFLVANEPQALECSTRGWGQLFSFGYSQKCCCAADHQPLYFAGLKIWNAITGISITSFRLFSSVFYIALIILAFIFSHKYFNSKIFAFIFSLSLILSARINFFAQYGYEYIHYIFFIFLALYFFQKESLNKTNQFIGTQISFLVASQVFYFGYFYFGIFSLYIYFNKKFKNIPKSFHIINLIALVLFIFKTPVLFVMRFQIRKLIEPEFTFLSSIENIMQLHFGEIFSTPLTMVFLLLFFLINLICFKNFRKSQSIFEKYLFLVFIISNVLFLTFALLNQFQEIRMRYFAPNIVILMIILINFLKNLPKLKYLMTCIIIIPIFGINIYAISKIPELYINKSDENFLSYKNYFEENDNGIVYYDNVQANITAKGIMLGLNLKFKKFSYLDNELCEKQPDSFLYINVIEKNKVQSELSIECSDKYKISKTKMLKRSSFPHEWLIIIYQKI